MQLVLVLLSNPQTANNPQAQILANQAIGYATQALQEVSSPTPTPETPIQINIPANPTTTIIYIPQPETQSVSTGTVQDSGLGIGAPDLSSIVTPSTPGCTLSGTRIVHPDPTQYDSIDFIWSSQGIPSGTIGWLRDSNRTSNGYPDFNYGYGMVNGFQYNGIIIQSLNGESTSTAWDYYWRLDFNGTYCYAEVK